MSEDNVVAMGHNLPDPKDLQGFINEAIEHEESLEEIRAHNRVRVKEEMAPIKDDLKALKKHVKDTVGCTISVFNQLVKEQYLPKKARNSRANLDVDELDHLRALEDSLGDLKGTPLGDAAVANASK